MKEQKATLISVSTKTDEEMAWHARKNVVADFEGFVDDVHRGPSRVCYEGDTEPAGTSLLYTYPTPRDVEESPIAACR